MTARGAAVATRRARRCAGRRGHIAHRFRLASATYRLAFALGCGGGGGGDGWRAPTHSGDRASIARRAYTCAPSGASAGVGAQPLGARCGGGGGATAQVCVCVCVCYVCLLRHSPCDSSADQNRCVCLRRRRRVDKCARASGAQIELNCATAQADDAQRDMRAERGERTRTRANAQTDRRTVRLVESNWPLLWPLSPFGCWPFIPSNVFAAPTLVVNQLCARARAD